MQLAPNERDNGARRKVKSEKFRDTSRTASLKADSLDSRVTDTPDRDCTADQNLQAVPSSRDQLQSHHFHWPSSFPRWQASRRAARQCSSRSPAVAADTAGWRGSDFVPGCSYQRRDMNCYSPRSRSRLTTSSSARRRWRQATLAVL